MRNFPNIQYKIIILLLSKEFNRILVILVYTIYCIFKSQLI